jgi:hypothetical protein
VIGNRDTYLEAKVRRRRGFSPQLVFERCVRPVALAEAAIGLQLDLLFAEFAGAHCEPKDELRIDFGGAPDQRGRHRCNENSNPSSCIHGA